MKRLERSMWMVLLTLLACDGRAANPEPTPSTDPVPSMVPSMAAPTVEEAPAEPEPARQPAPERAERLDARRLQGPARSLCGVVRRMLSGPVDCDRIGLREREDNLIRVRESLEPEGPWLAVHFVDVLLDEEGFDSYCALLVRTRAGWFVHGLDGMLCANSGSVRVDVGAVMRWEPIGPDGSKRLVVAITEGMSHMVDGQETHEELLICGETEGRVACHWMRVGASFVEGDPDLVPEDLPLPDDWRAEVTFLPSDRIRVGEHGAPTDSPRAPPAAGIYGIHFDAAPQR